MQVLSNPTGRQPSEMRQPSHSNCIRRETEIFQRGFPSSEYYRKAAKLREKGTVQLLGKAASTEQAENIRDANQ